MRDTIKTTYEYLFSMFLIEETPLLDIDKMICEFIEKKSDFNKSGADSTNLSIGKAMFGLSNFKLMSTAHVERLSAEDYSVFEKVVNEQNKATLEVAKRIVKTTFKYVMCANPDEPEIMSCLGPYPDPIYCFDNDSIVLAIDTNDYDNLQLPDLERLREMLEDMKCNLFTTISEDIDAKIELFVG